MSALEDLLAEQLTREGIEFVREYKFLDDRRFRAANIGHPIGLLP